MKQKNSFLLYNDQSDMIEKLTDKQAGVLLKKIYTYNNNGRMPPDIKDPVLDMVFTSIKTSLDRDYIKYCEVCKTRSESGKQGGRPKKQV